LAGRTLADGETIHEIVEGQFLPSGKKESVDFAYRAWEGEVFAQMDKEFDHLPLGGGC
jgi:hypothetical protein